MHMYELEADFRMILTKRPDQYFSSRIKFLYTFLLQKKKISLRLLGNMISYALVRLQLPYYVFPSVYTADLQ